MHWIAPSEKNDANGTLENRLWESADQFRANSGLKSQEYSAPVLGLIFLRFAEVRFALQRAKLEKAGAKGGNGHSPRRGSRMDDPAAYHADGVHRGDIQAERKGGLWRASVRDFHSFRVTWVTLALTAGVPLELVQKVTGHKTTDIVLKHYVQPGREDFRRALQSAMPKLLTNGQKSPKDEMKDILDGMMAKNWKKGKARLLALLGKV
jgi:integrase